MLVGYGVYVGYGAGTIRGVTPSICVGVGIGSIAFSGSLVADDTCIGVASGATLPGLLTISIGVAVGSSVAISSGGLRANPS